MGIMAGLIAEAISQDLRCSIPQGTRRIRDREIHDAVDESLADHGGGTFPTAVTLILKSLKILGDHNKASPAVVKLGSQEKVGIEAYPVSPAHKGHCNIEKLFTFNK